MSDYASFLQAKRIAAPERGLRNIPALEAHLKGFQVPCVAQALSVGSAGCYLATGLGKTAVGLSFCRHAAEASNGWALILTPLAVARQIEREGRRWGYDIRVIRDQSQARAGINVCNYDRIDKLNPNAFGVVAFDEASIVKSFDGKIARALIAAFSGHRWRLALSATPAPNDHTEIGQQSELLGIMPTLEMLARWFINDSADTGAWRLKGHAVTSFWDWMASWARMAEHPRDMGFDDAGYDLPPLKIHRHRVAERDAPLGTLFGNTSLSATDIHDLKHQTIAARAEMAADVIGKEPGEAWLIWADTNYECDAIRGAIPDVTEVRGSDSIEAKEEALLGFADGSVRRLLTKPSIAGYGLNYQHCARQLFVGRSFSYELWHQAIRRSWRFGQTRQVDAHLIVADGEDAIGRVLDRKSEDHGKMREAMAAAMRRAIGITNSSRTLYAPTNQGRLPAWL